MRGAVADDVGIDEGGVDEGGVELTPLKIPRFSPSYTRLGCPPFAHCATKCADCYKCMLGKHYNTGLINQTATMSPSLVEGVQRSF